MPNKPRYGDIVWTDLTVPDAERIRDFYAAVVGWQPQDITVGDHVDFNMTQSDGTPAAGVCHAAGENAALPPQWLVYITVPDLNESIARCRALGGEVIAGPRGSGGDGRFWVIRDPAGAVCALLEPPSD